MYSQWTTEFQCVSSSVPCVQVVVEHQSVRFTPALAHLDPKLSSPLWMELSEMHSKEDHMVSLY